jgi:Lon protease-like protein
MLEDEQEASDSHVEAARSSYAEVVEKATDERPTDADLADMDAYRMAATIELEPELKQRLLDSRSEEERLDIVEELFTRAVERLERAEHVSEVARSNGKVRF